MNSKQTEERLYEEMSVFGLDLDVPSFNSLTTARELVRQRKPCSLKAIVYSVTAAYHALFHKYQLGFCAILSSSGFLLFTDYPPGGGATALQNEYAQSGIMSGTICVSSSTLLTSIPTLIIRN